MKKSAPVIVFLGPSLPRAEAQALLKAEFRAPAEQGDVWHAMQSQPRAIVLIDGVFESRPSVWHHEIRSALDAGIAVFGASSMGALRAAELTHFGMVGVGHIFSMFHTGEWNDDADVALLHGPADFGFKGITIPLVNVRHNAHRAQQLGVLNARQQKECVAVARSIFYQARTWAVLRDALKTRWSASVMNSFENFWRTEAEDLKATDARLCLSVVAEFMKSPRPPVTQQTTALSSYARSRWLSPGSKPTPAGEEALRVSLVAELGRLRGLRASELHVQVWQKRFLDAGADASHARRWAELHALEELTRTHHVAVSGGRVSRLEANAMARRQK